MIELNSKINPFVEIQNQIDKRKQLKIEIQNLIKSLPDNKVITRLSSNCFTINAKDLGNNWTPFYHDFKMQSDKLAEIVEHTELENLEAKLLAIISSGTYRSGNYTWRFNPIFVSKLKALLPI